MTSSRSLLTPPRAERPQSREQWRFKPIPAAVEWVEAYRPGGYHPVHIGETFKDNRYRVLRKLGYGSFSTVWLAQDTQTRRYVALKVKVASVESRNDNELSILLQIDPSVLYITRLTDHFEIQGPNGLHLCLVFEDLGVSVAGMLEDISNRSPPTRGMPARTRFPTLVVKSIVRQVLRGLAALHSLDIVHGDVQPGNILAACDDIDSIPLADLIGHEDTMSFPVERLDGQVDQWAPRYIALPDDLLEDVEIELSANINIKLMDLGAAFHSNTLGAKPITPLALRAPEIILHSSSSTSTFSLTTSIDIWSVGCLTYEFLTGTPLFSVLGGALDLDACDDDHILQMHDVLGPLPMHICRHWSNRHRYFHDDGVLYNTVVQGPEAINQMQTLEKSFMQHRPEDMDDVEAKSVLTLIRSALTYQSNQRPSSEQLLQHAWLQD